MQHSTEITEPSCRTAKHRRWLVALLILAGVLRIGLILRNPATLSEDRDLYWGIARSVAAGDGYRHPDLGHPTAYRPPLYPLLLTGIVLLGGGAKSLAVIQVALGVVTVCMTWRLGQRLNLGATSWIAAAFVAANPLLIQSGALAMTETLCTFLIVAMLLAMPVANRESAANRDRNWGAMTLGILLGLAVLCRPTVIVFLFSSMTFLAVRQARSGWPSRSVCVRWLVVVLAFGATLAPWTVRNWVVMGEPIVMTTHGGYTLLLGNNDEFYRVEVLEADGTLWDSQPWQKQLRQNLADVGLRNDQEVAIDRHMTNLAWTWIKEHPAEFWESCWLRLKRFWNVVPSGSDAGSLPAPVRWGIALFFVVELAAAAIGLLKSVRCDVTHWWPLVLLVSSFAAVHLVYWSNLRMRAPVEPILALFAARGIQAITRSSTSSTSTDRSNS